MKRFRTCSLNQPFLLPPSLQDWLPENHLARFIADVVDSLDLSAIYSVYARKDNRGVAAYHPRMLTRLLLYGYATGLTRAYRQIGSVESCGFRWNRRMPSRYELSDPQWERIKDVLPGRKGTIGRTAADNRLFVNGVLWILRSGARWSDLPERYGKYKSIHKRFARWTHRSVWEQVFADLVRDRKNEYLMIDSTIVRAHQQVATGPKKGVRTRLWGVPEEV